MATAEEWMAKTQEAREAEASDRLRRLVAVYERPRLHFTGVKYAHVGVADLRTLLDELDRLRKAIRRP